MVLLQFYSSIMWSATPKTAIRNGFEPFPTYIETIPNYPGMWCSKKIGTAYIRSWIRKLEWLCTVQEVEFRDGNKPFRFCSITVHFFIFEQFRDRSKNVLELFQLIINWNVFLTVLIPFLNRSYLLYGTFLKLFQKCSWAVPIP